MQLLRLAQKMQQGTLRKAWYRSKVSRYIKNWRPGFQNQWVQQDPPHFRSISCKNTTRVALVAPPKIRNSSRDTQEKNTIKHLNKQALIIDYTDLSHIESTSVESMWKRNAALSCLVWRVNQMKAKVQPTYWPAQSQLPGEWVTSFAVGKKSPFSSMTTWQWIDEARTQDTARTR